MHKDIEARDEQIVKLKSENEELQELAQHVQYMADMIEVWLLLIFFPCLILVVVSLLCIKAWPYTHSCLFYCRLGNLTKVVQLPFLESVLLPKFVPSFQRLTGKSPDNLEELRELALDVEETEHDDDDVDGQSEDEADYYQSDSEEEASDHEQARRSGDEDWHNQPFHWILIFQSADF